MALHMLRYSFAWYSCRTPQSLNVSGQPELIIPWAVLSILSLGILRDFCVFVGQREGQGQTHVLGHSYEKL